MGEFFSNLAYFINLTGSDEVIWIVLPLFIVTVAMVIYFERYKDEWPGWNTLVANSLVLLFVAMMMLEYIHGLDGAGAINFINYSTKSLLSVFIALIGIFLAISNFHHSFPKKIARQISSPLTINLIAYVILLYVYSDIGFNLVIFSALLTWFVLLVISFNLIKILLRRFFKKIQKLKEKEEIEDIRDEKKPVKEKKDKIKKIEEKVRKEKSGLEKQEKEIDSKAKKKISELEKKSKKLKKEAKKK